jgi:hypothetical protein
VRSSTGPGARAWGKAAVAPARLRVGATLVALAVLVMLIGELAGAWSSSPKGDDALFHLANVRFFQANLPYVWWFPASHAGEPLLSVYPVAYYLLLAALHGVGVSLGSELQISLAVSLAISVTSLFALARRLGLNLSLAAALALLPLTAPPTWIVSLVGGAYIRVAALPFFLLSVCGVYWLIANLRESSSAVRPYLVTVAALTCAALLHPFVLQFTLPIVVSLVIVGHDGWKTRIRVTIALVLPVIALSAWQYVPVLTSFLDPTKVVPGAPRHDTTPMRPEWLLALPEAGKWSIGLGPMLSGAGVLGVVVLLWLARRRRPDLQLKMPVVLLAVLTAWSIYFVSMAWLPMPRSLYLMASYDYALWASMTLALGSVALVAVSVRAWPATTDWLTVALPVVIVASCLALAPWVRSVSTIAALDVPHSRSQEAMKPVDLALQMADEGSRLGAVDRTYTRWLSYARPTLQYLGGRSGVSPHRYFYEVMLRNSFYRLDRLDELYFDDRPRVSSTAVGLKANFYPAMFWLDWYGARVAVVDSPFSSTRRTAAGYRKRPQFFRTRLVPTPFNAVTVAEINGARAALVSSSDAPVIAIPFAGDTSALYGRTLQLLSSLDLGPDSVVPVQVPSADHLEAFRVALTDEERFRRHTAVFDDFVRDGGRLLVVAAQRASVAPRVVTLARGLSLSGRVGYVPIPPGGRVFAGDRGHPMGVCVKVASGRRCVLGASLGSLAESRDLTAPLVLLRGLGVAMDLRITPAWARAGTSAPRPPSAGQAVPRREETRYRLSRRVPSDARGYVELAFRGTRVQGGRVLVTLSDGSRRLRCAFSPDERRHGTSRATLPLAAFTSTQGVAPPYFDRIRIGAEQGGEKKPAQLSRVRIVTLGPRRANMPLDGEWLRPTRFRVEVEGSRPSGLLWKESFDDAWRAEGDGHLVDLYPAGPGMIWAPIDGRTRSVSFDMGIPSTFVLGAGVSAMLIVCVVFACARAWKLGLRISDPEVLSSPTERKAHGRPRHRPASRDPLVPDRE